jgi:hypothetical protein
LQVPSKFNQNILIIYSFDAVPGYNQLEKYADDSWGSGSRNVVTNPKEYLGSPASVCIQTDAVKLSFSGKPTCHTTSANSESQLNGTKGDISIEVQNGFDVSTSLTTTSLYFLLICVSHLSDL